MKNWIDRFLDWIDKKIKKDSPTCDCGDCKCKIEEKQ